MEHEEFTILYRWDPAQCSWHKTLWCLAAKSVSTMFLFVVVSVVTLFINTGQPHSAMRLKFRGALYGLITFSETFSPQNYLSDGWSVNLFSAYYPLIISGFSIIICFWAEVSTAQYFTVVLIINLLIANLSDHSHFYLITKFGGLHMIKKGGGIGKEVVQY